MTVTLGDALILASLFWVASHLTGSRLFIFCNWVWLAWVLGFSALAIMEHFL